MSTYSEEATDNLNSSYDSDECHIFFVLSVPAWLNEIDTVYALVFSDFIRKVSFFFN